MTVLLAACGGTSSSILDESGSSSGGSSGGGTGPTLTLAMGSGTGTSFQSGVLAVSSASLSAGGSTSLQVSIVDENQALYTTATQITFSSPCQSKGLATITATGSSPAGPTITTSTGAATATYVATGCSGTDTITASAAANSQNLTATGKVTVAAAQVGSISFISATPSNISLKGTGTTTGGTSTATSTVIFKVLDTSGGPRAGATVTFALSTTVGGITLSPASATTDVNGQAQTVVSGGTVATSVRVTATTTAADGNAISTESSALTVSTGVPTSQNMSLAVKCENVEAWVQDGQTVPVTIAMTDRFSNPVPDGTTASFQTALGGIQATCQTGSNTPGSGSCTVNWTSKAPRAVYGNPRTTPSTPYTNTADNWCGVPANPFPPYTSYCSGTSNGRSAILVTAIGEESFIDTNGTGIFNSGDSVPFDPEDKDNNFANGVAKPWFDTSEPFLNQWEIYDAYGTPTYVLGEPFIDFNSNGLRDGPDGLFEGSLCTGPYCNTKSTTVSIYGANTIVMSGSTTFFTVFQPQLINGTVVNVVQNPLTHQPAFDVTKGTIYAYIYDVNYQIMPATSGVTVAFTTNAGTLTSPTPAAVPCGAPTPLFNADGTVKSAGSLYGFGVSEAATPAAGSMFITVTTPLGLVTTTSVNLSN